MTNALAATRTPCPGSHLLVQMRRNPDFATGINGRCSLGDRGLAQDARLARCRPCVIDRYRNRDHEHHSRDHHTHPQPPPRHPPHTGPRRTGAGCCDRVGRVGDSSHPGPSSLCGTLPCPGDSGPTTGNGQVGGSAEGRVVPPDISPAICPDISGHVQTGHLGSAAVGGTGRLVDPDVQGDNDGDDDRDSGWSPATTGVCTVDRLHSPARGATADPVVGVCVRVGTCAPGRSRVCPNWPSCTTIRPVSGRRARKVSNAGPTMIAMNCATRPRPGWKTNADGPRRRWGSRCADRRSCHHAASAITKNPSTTINDSTMNTPPDREQERQSPASVGAPVAPTAAPPRAHRSRHSAEERPDLHWI